MGGYEGGQEASRLAVETVRDVYSRAPNGDPQAALLRALQSAHECIRNYANGHPGHYGMGTTCTALVLKGDSLHFAHVGDSRLYLARGAEISQLTRDHSYVSRLVQSGLISLKEAENHPQRHILTAALGNANGLVPHIPDYPVPLENRDILVLCTDGLWGQVSPGELRDVVCTKAPSEACRELVKLARERGGPDNITVQLLYLGRSGHEPCSCGKPGPISSPGSRAFPCKVQIDASFGQCEVLYHHCKLLIIRPLVDGLRLW